jgi:hypothetical protein
MEEVDARDSVKVRHPNVTEEDVGVGGTFEVEPEIDVRHIQVGERSEGVRPALDAGGGVVVKRGACDVEAGKMSAVGDDEDRRRGILAIMDSRPCPRCGEVDEEEKLYRELAVASSFRPRG